MPCKWDCYFAIETHSLYLSATYKNNNNILQCSRDILEISLMSLALVVRWSKKQVDCVRTFIRYQPKFIFDNTISICIWISMKTSRFQGNNCLHFKLTPRYSLMKSVRLKLQGFAFICGFSLAKSFAKYSILIYELLMKYFVNCRAHFWFDWRPVCITFDWRLFCIAFVKIRSDIKQNDCNAIILYKFKFTFNVTWRIWLKLIYNLHKMNFKQ